VHRSEEPSARDNQALVLVYSTHVFQDLFIDGAVRPAELPPLRTCIDFSQTSNQVECAL
jgi:hypothetical protein